MDKSIYDYKFKVGTFDVGLGSKIRLSSILKYQMEAGERHLTDYFGLDYNTLKSQNNVFVIVNLIVKVYRSPVSGENITLTTWSKEVKGLKFFRAYKWFDENGELLIESISCCVLVDAKEHKLLKPDVLGFDFPTGDREISIQNPKKLRLSKELTEAGKREIYFSMLDSNEHLNNAFYADFAVDFIEKELAENIKEFSIDFVKEAKCGEEIIIETAEENGTSFIHGKVGDNTCFRAEIK